MGDPIAQSDSVNLSGQWLSRSSHGVRFHPLWLVYWVLGMLGGDMLAQPCVDRPRNREIVVIDLSGIAH